MTIVIPEKYQPAELPKTPEEAITLADERDEWAKAARERDQPGSAREFELTSLLLRAFARRLKISSVGDE